MYVKSFFGSLSVALTIFFVQAAQPAAPAAPAAAPHATTPASSADHHSSFPCTDWCQPDVCKGRRNVVTVCHKWCSSSPQECQKFNPKDKSLPNTFDCHKLCTEQACKRHPHAQKACQHMCKPAQMADACKGKMHHMKEKMHHMAHGHGHGHDEHGNNHAHGPAPH